MSKSRTTLPASIEPNEFPSFETNGTNELLFQLAPLPMWVYDLETLRFLAVNDVAVSFYGYSRRKFLSMTARDIRPPEEMPKFHEAMNQFRRTGKQVGGVWLHRKSDGTKAYVTVTSRRIEFKERAALLVLVNDITPYHEAMESVREFPAKLLDAQEAERRRIARELHDSTIQNLITLGFDLEILGLYANSLPEQAQRALTNTREIFEQCLQEVRSLTNVLHPPTLDELGLLESLQWFVSMFARQSCIKVTLDTPEKLDLPRNVELAIYRIVQASLINIRQHSCSPTASVQISRSPEALELVVADQGRGIRGRRRSESIGLTSMKERVEILGGSFDFKSSNNGTVLTVLVPITETTCNR